MQVLKRVVLGVVVLVLVLAVIGFLLPRRVTVARQMNMAAPAPVVFAVVDGFGAFERWSPWQDKVPGLKAERSGPPYGVGARYTWSASKLEDSGSQEIIADAPYSSVRMKLNFGGFEQPSESSFKIEPAGASVLVIWRLTIDMGYNPVNRWFGLMMDGQVGPDYEKGLARLKTVVEAMPKTDLGALAVERVEVPDQPYVYVSGSAPTTDFAAIGKALGAAFGKLKPFVDAAGLKEVAPPIAITRRYDETQKVYAFDAGLPIDKADAAVPAGGEIKLGKLAPGWALGVTHKGPYAELPKTYALIEDFKKVHGLSNAGDSWEQYVSDPGTTPEAQLTTWVFVPVK